MKIKLFNCFKNLKTETLQQQPEYNLHPEPFAASFFVFHFYCSSSDGMWLLNNRVRLYRFIILSGQQSNIWVPESGWDQSVTDNWVAGTTPWSCHCFGCSRAAYGPNANTTAIFACPMSYRQISCSINM